MKLCASSEVHLQDSDSDNHYIGQDSQYSTSGLFGHDFAFTKYTGDVVRRADMQQARRLLEQRIPHYQAASAKFATGTRQRLQAIV